MNQYNFLVILILSKLTAKIMYKNGIPQ